MAEAVPFLFYDVVVAVVTTFVLSVMTFGGIGGSGGAICDFYGTSAAGSATFAAKVGNRCAAAKIANTNAFYH